MIIKTQKKFRNGFIRPLLFVLVFLIFSFFTFELKGIAANGRETTGIKNDDPLSGEYRIKKNIFYKTGSDLSKYEKERCFLDLYLPKGRKNFPVMVWFHGGSLARCSKDDVFTQQFAKHFAQKGVGMAVVNYRLSPKVRFHLQQPIHFVYFHH